MVFSEMSAFLRAVQGILTDEDVRSLQNHLLQMPKAGSVIRGTGGVRKFRWSAKSKGKRAGARIIYFYAEKKQWVYLLFAYTKDTKLDLTEAEKKQFAKLVKELL
jgi:hypothetical protein